MPTAAAHVERPCIGKGFVQVTTAMATPAMDGGPWVIVAGRATVMDMAMAVTGVDMDRGTVVPGMAADTLTFLAGFI